MPSNASNSVVCLLLRLHPRRQICTRPATSQAATRSLCFLLKARPLRATRRLPPLCPPFCPCPSPADEVVPRGGASSMTTGPVELTLKSKMCKKPEPDTAANTSGRKGENCTAVIGEKAPEPCPPPDEDAGGVGSHDRSGEGSRRWLSRTSPSWPPERKRLLRDDKDVK